MCPLDHNSRGQDVARHRKHPVNCKSLSTQADIRNCVFQAAQQNQIFPGRQIPGVAPDRRLFAVHGFSEVTCKLKGAPIVILVFCNRQQLPESFGQLPAG